VALKQSATASEVMMGNNIPDGAWTAAILVLVYSVVCLGLSVLLACMLVANGSKLNCECTGIAALYGMYRLTEAVCKDVTLIAIFISLSSITSIVQQVYFALDFRHIEYVELEVAKESLQVPALAFVPLFKGFNLALYEIQWWCYCIISILIFF